MKKLLFLLMLVPLPACAGRLGPFSFTAPGFEAAATGDTCAASTIPQTGVLVIRRNVTGPVAFTDSLVGVTPGSPQGFGVVDVPRGNYVVEVVAVDEAGNESCPASLAVSVKGKPAKPTWGWLKLADDQRSKLLALRDKDVPADRRHISSTW
jgi:hypothetical protein